MSLRTATDADYVALFGTQAPSAWIGLVSEADGKKHGIGGAYRGDDGRWWVFFQRCPGVRMTKTAHKAARQIVDVMRDAGLRGHALPDWRIDGAEVWLMRLGFRKTDEQIEGIDVWTL